jgi:hypothetical protein
MPPRCPKGTRRNKNTKICESSGATHVANKTVRCPKGTRRNKQTGDCDSATGLDKKDNKETKDLYFKKCLISVEKNGLALKKVDTSKFVKYWKKDMSESDVDVFRHISQTAIKQNPKAVKYLDFECRVLDKYDVEELCLLAVEKDGMLLRDIPEVWRWDDVIGTAIKQNGMALQYNPNDYSSEDWDNDAVKQNGMALQFIFDPDVETQIFAVKQNGLAFQFVHRNTFQFAQQNKKKDDEDYERIFEFAVKQNPRAKKFYVKP